MCGTEPLYSDPGATAFWLPGYPVLAALLRTLGGTDARVLYVANAAMGALAVFLLARTAGRYFGHRGAWLAGLLLALAPTQILFTGMASTECLSVLLWAAFLALLGELASPRRQEARVATLIGLGLIGGLGALTRSNFLSLLLLTTLALGAVAGRSRARLHMGIPLGIAGLCLFPWLGRNLVVFGAPLYATNGGLNLLVGFSEHATGGFTLAGVPCLKYPEYTERARDTIYRAMAMDWIGSHPVQSLWLTIVKLARLVNPFPAGHAGLTFWASGCYNLVFLGAAALGSARGLSSSSAQSRLVWLTLVALLGYALPIVFAFAITRFRVPMEPALALLAAATFRLSKADGSDGVVGDLTRTPPPLS